MSTADGLIWNIIIFIILLCASSLLFYISIKGFKERNFYSGFSTISCAILFLFFAFYEIFYGLFPYPYDAYFTIAIGIIIVIHFSIWAIRRKKTTNIQKDRSQNDFKENISLQEEYMRKSFHLVGILVPIGFYWVFPWINNLIFQIINSPKGSALYELLWGDVLQYPYILDDPNASGELIYFVLWLFLFFVLVPDFIRILRKSEYTLFHRILKSILRRKEYISTGPQVLLILGAVFSFFLAKLGLYSYEIAVSAAFTATLADGIVAVLGRQFGKRKIRVFNGDKKTVLGFIIGFFSAYLFSMIILGPIYAIAAAVIFLVLDIITIPIADNLLNPILLSVGVWGFQLLLKMPMGWGF